MIPDIANISHIYNYLTVCCVCVRRPTHTMGFPLYQGRISHRGPLTDKRYSYRNGLLPWRERSNSQTHN